MKKIFILTVFSVCLTMLSAVYSVSVQREIAENITRLHIIANSNSHLDQAIKYAVRDEVLLFAKQSRNVPKTNEMENIANSYLSRIGVPYTATASVENCYVPKKNYKSIALPQGRYDCIKITLGDGKGENWWCVAYPPLCYTEAMFGELSEDAMKELSKRLSKDTLKTILSDRKINFRLKIVDEVQKVIYNITENL